MIKRNVDETRRRFLALIGLSPIVAVMATTGLRGREHSRFYSVRRGHQGTVYCNGLAVPFAISCKTGCRGWVVHWAGRNDDIDRRYVSPLRCRMTGNVTFRPLKDNEKAT